MAGEAPGRRTAVLVLALTFLAGAGTGAGLYASFGHAHRPHHGAQGRLPPLLEELELTADQRQKATVIFEKYRPRFEAVFAESGPRVRALRDEVDAELMPLLTDAQRARFEELKKNRPPPGPPGVPPGPPP